MKIAIKIAGKRVYVEGPGEGPIRMVPLSDKAFWIQPLQSIAVFEKKDDKVTQVVFQIGEHQLVANKTD
jgi:hypothetical protein